MQAVCYQATDDFPDDPEQKQTDLQPEGDKKEGA